MALDRDEFLNQLSPKNYSMKPLSERMAEEQAQQAAAQEPSEAADRSLWDNLGSAWDNATDSIASGAAHLWDSAADALRPTGHALSPDAFSAAPQRERADIPDFGTIDGITVYGDRVKPEEQESQNGVNPYLAAIGNGLIQGKQDILNAESMVGDWAARGLGEGNFLGGLARRAADEARAEARGYENIKYEKSYQPTGLGRFGEAVLENAPQIATQAALAAASRGATVPTAFMGASIAGNTYGDLLDRGVDPSRASMAALANAGIQMPMEALGGVTSWFKVKDILANHGLLKAVGKSAATEGATEALQEAPDELIRYWAEHNTLDGFDWGELGLNAAEAGAVGAFYGGLLSGAGYQLNKKNQTPEEAPQETSAEETTPEAQLTPLTPEQMQNAYAQQETSQPAQEEAQPVQEEQPAPQSQLTMTPEQLQSAYQQEEPQEAPEAAQEEAPAPEAPKPDFSNNRAAYAMQRLIDHGYSPVAASGIVGGLMTESGGNTFDLNSSAVNPDSGAYGIGQWLGSRQDALRAFAAERGTDLSDLDTQIDFIAEELGGSESAARDAINGAENPEDAAILADSQYERSEGTEDIRSAKAKNARAVYDAWMNGGGKAVGGSTRAESITSVKSAEDFLKEIRDAMPIETTADEERIHNIDDTIRTGNDEEKIAAAKQLAEEMPKEKPFQQAPAQHAPAIQQRRAGAAPAVSPIEMGKTASQNAPIQMGNKVSTRPLSQGYTGRIRRATPGEIARAKADPVVRNTVKAADAGDPNAQQALRTLSVNPDVIEAVRKDVQNENQKGITGQNQNQPDRNENAKPQPAQTAEAKENAKNQPQEVAQYQPPKAAPAAPQAPSGNVLANMKRAAKAPAAPGIQTVPQSVQTQPAPNGQTSLTAPQTTPAQQTAPAPSDNVLENMKKTSQEAASSAKQKETKPSDLMEAAKATGHLSVGTIPSDAPKAETASKTAEAKPEAPKGGYEYAEDPQKAKEALAASLGLTKIQKQEEADKASKAEEQTEKAGEKAGEKALHIVDFIDDSDAALERALKDVEKHSGQLNAGVDPELLLAYFRVGAILAQRGANRLAAFTDTMVKHLGEKAREWAEPVFRALEKVPKGVKYDANNMTTAVQYVGSMYERGVKDLDAIERDFAKDYGEAAARKFHWMFDAALTAVQTRENAKIEHAKPDESKEDKKPEAKELKFRPVKGQKGDWVSSDYSVKIDSRGHTAFVIFSSLTADGIRVPKYVSSNIPAHLRVERYARFNMLPDSYDDRLFECRVYSDEDRLNQVHRFIQQENTDATIIPFDNAEWENDMVSLRKDGKKYVIRSRDKKIFIGPAGDHKSVIITRDLTDEEALALDKALKEVGFSKDGEVSGDPGFNGYYRNEWLGWKVVERYNQWLDERGAKEKAEKIKKAEQQASQDTEGTRPVSIEENIRRGKEAVATVDEELNAGEAKPQSASTAQSKAGGEAAGKKSTVATDDAKVEVYPKIQSRVYKVDRANSLKAILQKDGNIVVKDTSRGKDTVWETRGEDDVFARKRLTVSVPVKELDKVVMSGYGNPPYKIRPLISQKMKEDSERFIASQPVEQQADMFSFLANKLYQSATWNQMLDAYESAVEDVYMQLRHIDSWDERFLAAKVARQVRDPTNDGVPSQKELPPKAPEKTAKATPETPIQSKVYEADNGRGLSFQAHAEPSGDGYTINTAELTGRTPGNTAGMYNLSFTPEEIEKARDKGSSIGSLVEDKMGKASPVPYMPIIDVSTLDPLAKAVEEVYNQLPSAAKHATVEETEKGGKDHAGRLAGPAGPVEVQLPEESESAEEAGRGSGKARAGQDGRSDRPLSGQPGNHEPAERREVRGRSGQNDAGEEHEPDDRRRDDERGAEVPVKESISPEVDKVETKVERKEIKDAGDVVRQDFVLKAPPKRTDTQRAKDNAAAIKLLKKIESEHRMATPAEQEILAKYSGWGGLSSALKKMDAETLGVTDAEYKAIREESVDAFYTPKYVADAMWKIVGQLGFKGGRVLDPSTGSGTFFGTMPKGIHSKSSLNGVELSAIPARIASQLYQKSRIDNMGFEEAKMADGYYDLAITNVPFNSAKPYDPTYKSAYKTHNYFFAKAIDKVRPGGLVVFLTSRNTMDGNDDAAVLRKHLNGKAKFIGAIRLPTETFTDTNAVVTTDIIVLQKLKDGETVNNPWEKTINEEKEGQTYSENTYYRDHPEMVIGEPVLSHSGPYTAIQWTLGSGTANDVKKRLTSAIKNLPKNIYKAQRRTAKDNIERYRASEEDLVGSVTSKGGQHYIVTIGEDGGKYLESLTPKENARVTDFLTLQNALDDVLAKQGDPTAKDETIEASRAVLNKAYDDFVRKNGALHEPRNLSTLSRINSSGRVLALEDYTKKTKKHPASATKADIFTKRTTGANEELSITTPSDAMYASLQETGHIDLDYMAGALKTDKDSLIEALTGQIIKDPATGDYVPTDEYLSGNIREKLAYAESAAAQDPSYKKNVKRLQETMPKDLTSADVKVDLGTSWIPESDMADFVIESLQLNDDDASAVSVKHSAITDKWEVKAPQRGAIAFTILGTPKVSFVEILNAVLNGKAIKVNPPKDPSASQIAKAEKETVAAQAKAREVKRRFEEWIWQDGDRKERLLKYYNNTYNAVQERAWDGSFLTLPGFTSTAKLMKHQKDAIWRMVNTKSTLLAHVVGAGKTWTMQTAGMEMRRMGTARKIVYTMPKNTVQQFTKDFYRIYPNAKILVLSSETLPEPAPKGKVHIVKGKKVPFTLKEMENNRIKNAKRNAALQRIKTGDWDAIVMSHETFKRIPMSDASYEQFYAEQVDQAAEVFREAKEKGMDMRGIEEKLKKLEATLKNYQNREEKTDVGEDTFETLGIDQLFVDEADLFKNLEFTTTFGNVRGIQNTGSQRSADMYIKTRYLMHNPSCHGVVFATGTPVSNTIAELYTMMRYLEEDRLKEVGINSFDAFAKTFLDITNDGVEMKPTGDGWRIVSMVKAIKNLPEVIKLFHEVADVKTVKELPEIASKRPIAKRIPVMVEESPWQKWYRENVVKERALAMAHRGRSKKGEDNPLKLMGDNKKAALDPRLIDPSVPPEEANGKINAVCDHVYEEYVNSESTKGTQVLFCDLSVPKAKKNEDSETTNEDDGSPDAAASVYERIKRGLIEKGIPENEVAFVHDAKNDTAKQELFEAVNEGKIRVIIGTTAKMGAGTNMQKHLIALHHIDCPWRPRDLEQQEGRILRQGNQNKEVRIYNYATKNSFDAVAYDKIRIKAGNMSGVLSGQVTERVMEDPGVMELSAEDMVMGSTGNPLQFEQMQAKRKLQSLTTERRAHEEEQQTIKKRIVDIPDENKRHQAIADAAKKDIAERDKHDKDFEFTVKDVTYTDRKQANLAVSKALIGATGKLARSNEPVDIGVVKGFAIRAVKRGNETGLSAYGYGVYTCSTNTAIGAYNTVMSAPERRVKDAENAIERNNIQLAALKKNVGQPFENEAEYQQAKQHLEELDEKIRQAMKEEEKQPEKAEEEPKELPDERYLVSEQSENLRSDSEILSEVSAAFPHASYTVDGSKVRIQYKDASITVNLADHIVVSEEESKSASKDYGRPVEAGALASGVTRFKAEREAFVKLARDGVPQTISHEAFHIAMRYGLNDREKAALRRKYGDDEEAMAEAYRHWMIQRLAGKGTLLGKIWTKVKDFAARVAGLFRENEYNTFRKLSSGEVYNRGVTYDPETGVKFSLSTKEETKAAEAVEAKSTSNLPDFLWKYKSFFKPELIRKIFHSAPVNRNPFISVMPGPNWRREAKNILDYGLLPFVRSPSLMKDPLVKTFFNHGDNALRTVTNLKNNWQKYYSGILDSLPTEKDHGDYIGVLLLEDAYAEELTPADMKAMGVSDEVIQAHNRTRALLDDIYEHIDDVRRQMRWNTRSFRSQEEAEKFSKSPFFKDATIKEEKKKNGTWYKVTYRAPLTWDFEDKSVTAAELRELKKDTSWHITEEKKNGDKYLISGIRSIPHLNKIKGYVPHIFHEWLILQEDEEGVRHVVGSGRTQQEAVDRADKLFAAEPAKYLIAPKTFSFQDESMKNPVLVGMKEMDMLTKGLEENLTLSRQEARQSLNAHTVSPHKFLGAMMHRKGAKGYEANVEWAINQHINSAARYCGLEPFKFFAINVFERRFGAFKDSYLTGAKGFDVRANFIQGYIQSMLGIPSAVNEAEDKILRLIPPLANMERPGKQISSAVLGTMSVLKLGASVSAGIVNVLQALNGVLYLGSRRMARGIARAAHLSKADRDFLRSMGTDNEVGLATEGVSEYTKLPDERMGRIAEELDKAGKMALKPFTAADLLLRRAVMLEAYDEGVKEKKMNTEKAVAYALGINRKVNFDYSIADAPRLFRAAEGEILASLSLQFQKYGLKEIEVLCDFFNPRSNIPKRRRLEFAAGWFAVAGLFNAVPLKDLLAELFGWLFDDNDPEATLKKHIMQWGNDNPALKGLAQASLYGLPALAGIDISSRAGLSSVLPDLKPGGAAWSTVKNLVESFRNDDGIGVARALSPTAGNIFQAVAGYNTDSKGRKTVDIEGFERALKALGFRTYDEAVSADYQRILYNERTNKTKKRQAAKEAYFDDPSEENRQKLKELGYKDSEIKRFKDPAKDTRAGRARNGMSKQDLKALEGVTGFVNGPQD